MFLREVEGRDEGVRSSRETTHIGFAPGGAGTTPLNSTDLLFLVTVSESVPQHSSGGSRGSGDDSERVYIRSACFKLS